MQYARYFFSALFLSAPVKVFYCIIGIFQHLEVFSCYFHKYSYSSQTIFDKCPFCVHFMPTGFCVFAPTPCVELCTALLASYKFRIGPTIFSPSVPRVTFKCVNLVCCLPRAPAQSAVPVRICSCFADTDGVPVTTDSQKFEEKRKNFPFSL